MTHRNAASFPDLVPLSGGGGHGAKWNRTDQQEIPAWLAEMDHPPPECVSAALADWLRTGHFGYPAWLTSEGTPLRVAFADRMRRRYNWEVDPANVREFCNVVQAFQAILEVATRERDKVMVPVPTWGPLLQSIVEMGRELVPVSIASGLAAEPIIAAATQSQPDTLVLVNPHNPTGQLWAPAELEKLATFAADHDILVVSDEIHADLTFQREFVPFVTAARSTLPRTVTLTSPSKAFNLAGLQCAIAHVSAPEVSACLDSLPSGLLGEISTPAVVAATAAWRHGDPWLVDLRHHLRRNHQLVRSRLGASGVRCTQADAGFLVWLDFRELHLPSEPAELIRSRGRVRLSPGTSFGGGGSGHARLNLGTSPELLHLICDRIEQALVTRQG